MSIATDLLLARTRRYVSTLSPAMAARILKAYAIMRTSLTDAEIAALLKDGASAERIALAITKEPWFRNAVTGVGTGAQDITLRSAKQYAAVLPGPAGRAVKMGIDLSNPLIATAMLSMKSRATAQLTKDLAATLTQAVKAGMEAGKGSAAIARTLRDVIGLAPNQEEAVRHFEEMLRAGDRAALTRALRDKRFDATLGRAMGKGGKGLSEAQVRTMADAYRRKMIAFNANTQARTLANDAQRAGQRLAWEDAIGKGVVDRGTLYKQRISLRDGKVREEHVAWDGEVRKFDEPYSSGEMVVGELEWGCRCLEVYFEDETGERFGAEGKGPRPPVSPAVQNPASVIPVGLTELQLAEAMRPFLETGDFDHYGLRIDVGALGVPGGIARPSRAWVDGDPTDEVLEGTSAVHVTADTLAARLKQAREYEGSDVALLGGYKRSYGEDENEVIIKDAVILWIGRRLGVA